MEMRNKFPGLELVPMIGDIRDRGRLEELIVAAKAGNRLSVVEKLDALVKGYSPMYEFHGAPEATGDIELDLPLPLPPSKSVH